MARRESCGLRMLRSPPWRVPRNGAQSALNTDGDASDRVSGSIPSLAATEGKTARRGRCFESRWDRKVWTSSVLPSATEDEARTGAPPVASRFGTFRGVGFEPSVFRSAVVPRGRRWPVPSAREFDSRRRLRSAPIVKKPPGPKGLGGFRVFIGENRARHKKHTKQRVLLFSTIYPAETARCCDSRELELEPPPFGGSTRRPRRRIVNRRDAHRPLPAAPTAQSGQRGARRQPSTALAREQAQGVFHGRSAAAADVEPVADELGQGRGEEGLTGNHARGLPPDVAQSSSRRR